MLLRHRSPSSVVKLPAWWSSILASSRIIVSSTAISSSIVWQGQTRHRSHKNGPYENSSSDVDSDKTRPGRRSRPSQPQVRRPISVRNTNNVKLPKKHQHTFKPADLQESPLAYKFHEACFITFVRLSQDSHLSEDLGVSIQSMKSSESGSIERTQMLDKIILQMLDALRFIVDKHTKEVHQLVQPTEKEPHLEAVAEVFEEYKKDLLETSSLYSDFENDLQRFRQYVENPPLVPSLGKIHAVLDNFEFPSDKAKNVEEEDEVLKHAMKLISASYLRFFRARLRISSFKSNPRINMTNPGEWYPRARALTRNVILHIGPTNSGKTYNALKALENAESGYYAGPLRLLAREVYNRMKAKGKKCNLITGEEVIEDYDEYGMPVKVSSGTVEMVDITNPMQVAVIDEIQMIEDSSRGWAWTQAFLGLQAKEIHLCGDPSSEQVVRDLVRIAGDTLTVKRYERLSPLNVERTALKGKLNLIRPGDCVIAFSKNDLLDWKAEIEAHHKPLKCAIIYGALPPESRSKQANSFNDPQSDVHFLVASDAVGMGLNLSIKRIVFLTVVKFDGEGLTRVSVSQIKQIAGRAGRFQVPQIGREVSAQNESNTTGGAVTAMHPQDLKYISQCMKIPTPTIRKAGLFASESLFRLYSLSFSSRRSFDQVLESMEVTSELNPMFYLCGVDQMTEISSFFRGIPGLSLNERITLSKSPVKTRNPLIVTVFKRLCTVVARTDSITLLDIPELITMTSLLDMPTGYKFKETDIANFETLHSVIVLYMWLSYRFPMNFRDREGAMELKALCEAKIDEALTSTRSARLAKWRRKVSKS